jgi:hypothetical protein
MRRTARRATRKGQDRRGDRDITAVVAHRDLKLGQLGDGRRAWDKVLWDARAAGHARSAWDERIERRCNSRIDIGVGPARV